MSATHVGIRSTRLVGPLAVLVALGAVAAANFSGNGENGGPGPFAISAVVIVVLGVYLFGRAIPNSIESGRPARLALERPRISERPATDWCRQSRCTRTASYA